LVTLRECRRSGSALRRHWVIYRMSSLTPELDRSRTPTLLTTNPDDPEWAPAAASAAAAHLRDGALVILPGSGRVGPLLQAAPAAERS
jgi:hypothetical protein